MPKKRGQPITGQVVFKRVLKDYPDANKHFTKRCWSENGFSNVKGTWLVTLLLAFCLHYTPHRHLMAITPCTFVYCWHQTKCNWIENLTGASPSLIGCLPDSAKGTESLPEPIPRATPAHENTLRTTSRYLKESFYSENLPCNYSGKRNIKKEGTPRIHNIVRWKRNSSGNASQSEWRDCPAKYSGVARAQLVEFQQQIQENKTEMAIKKQTWLMVN